jgi:hypothetical protein
MLQINSGGWRGTHVLKMFWSVAKYCPAIFKSCSASCRFKPPPSGSARRCPLLIIVVNVLLLASGPLMWFMRRNSATRAHVCRCMSWGVMRGNRST